MCLKAWPNILLILSFPSELTSSFSFPASLGISLPASLPHSGYSALSDNLTSIKQLSHYYCKGSRPFLYPSAFCCGTARKGHNWQHTQWHHYMQQLLAQTRKFVWKQIQAILRACCKGLISGLFFTHLQQEASLMATTVRWIQLILNLLDIMNYFLRTIMLLLSQIYPIFTKF